MHRALQILEVVERICSHFSSTAKNERGTLAALALTCTTLNDPALNIMWHTQTSMEPILLCLPADLFDHPRPISGRYLAVRLRRPITSADWERFRLYASRVREVIFSGPPTGVSAILPTLQVCFPSGLFPKLKSFNWASRGEDFRWISLFLNPSLLRLTLNCEPSFDNISLLSTLQQRCPQLTELVMHTRNSGASAVVHGLLSLQSFETASLDLEALKHLGQLSKVMDLKLHTLPQHAETAFASPLFSHLSSLTLVKTEIIPTTKFFSNCEGLSLKTLRLKFTKQPTVKEAEGLHIALVTAFSQDSLTTLSLSYYLTTPAPSTLRFTAHGGWLRSLFGFPNITSLSILPPAGFQFDDTTVKNIVHTWPHLETLELTERLSAKLLVSLHSIRRLATHCLFLTSLTLGVKVSLPLPSQARLPVAQRCLTFWDVMHSPISEPAPVPVARFLSGIFPNLRIVRTSYISDPKPNPESSDFDSDEEQVVQTPNARNGKCWKAVEAMLPEFVAAREEEHTRIKV